MNGLIVYVTDFLMYVSALYFLALLDLKFKIRLPNKWAFFIAYLLLVEVTDTIIAMVFGLGTTYILYDLNDDDVIRYSQTTIPILMLILGGVLLFH